MMVQKIYSGPKTSKWILLSVFTTNCITIGSNQKVNTILIFLCCLTVGAGTSGSVLAERLSEHFTVLLFEAGGNSNPLMSVPAFQNSFVNRQQTDFLYKSVPQKYACQNSVNQVKFCSLWYGNS